jgi:hypothetical protein
MESVTNDRQHEYGINMTSSNLSNDEQLKKDADNGYINIEP